MTALVFTNKLNKYLLGKYSLTLHIIILLFYNYFIIGCMIVSGELPKAYSDFQVKKTYSVLSI